MVIKMAEFFPVFASAALGLLLLPPAKWGIARIVVGVLLIVYAVVLGIATISVST